MDETNTVGTEGPAIGQSAPAGGVDAARDAARAAEGEVVTPAPEAEAPTEPVVPAVDTTAPTAPEEPVTPATEEQA